MEFILQEKAIFRKEDLQEDPKELKLVQKSIRLTEKEANTINLWPGKNFNDKFVGIMNYCMKVGDLYFMKALEIKIRREQMIKEIAILRRITDQLDTVFETMNSVNKMLGLPFSISKWRKVRKEALPTVKYVDPSEKKQPRTVHTTIRITESMELWINDWSDDGFSDCLDEIFKTCFMEEDLMWQELENIKRIRDRLLKQVRLMKLIRDSIASSLDKLETIMDDAADNCDCIEEEYALTGRDRRDSECRS